MNKIKSRFSKIGLGLVIFGIFTFHSFEMRAQDAKIYEACPGTEISLHFQSHTGTSVSAGELGVPKFTPIYECKEGGWCCPMEYA